MENSTMSAVGNTAGFTTIADLLRNAIARLALLARRGAWKRAPRTLELRETLSLGSRGFLAVVRFERQEFLVGGTSGSLALLAQLPEVPDLRGLREPAAPPQSED
jgi:flagellar biogenesis protein FliO